MPDFSDDRTMEDFPGRWREAFAALPLETPASDAWPRIAQALDAPASRRGTLQREHRMSWMIGLASAAVLVAVAWAPVSHWLRGGGEPAPAAEFATEAPGLRGPAAPLRNEAVSTKPAIEPPAVEESRIVASEAPATVAEPIRRKPARSARAAAPSHREAAPVVASSSRPAATKQTGTTAPTSAEAADRLQKLQSQSAQLEALIALARDERVANASSELLSSELDSGIAAVDAALSQPDLADDRRQDLWRQRVDLLRQLAGVEATSRWLAAQGASSEASLVSVY